VIVVDSNIIAYLFIPGEFTAKAERLLEVDSDWAAPALWRSEFRNILAGYLRRSDLTLAQAKAIQSEAEALMTGNEYNVESSAVFELVQNSNCSAYDCEFIALSRMLGTKLVTMDGKLLKAFPETAVGLVA
jgi:predicted nucleic acid-binding protein